MTKELMHWRTKGSKNGERNYQNEDGTWTDLGLERRRAEYRRINGSEGVTKGRKLARGIAAVGVAGGAAAAAGAGVAALAKNKNYADAAFAPGKDGKPSKAEKIANNSKDIADQINRLASIDRNTNRRLYLNDLSDAEIRRMVDRMDLERRYSEAVARETPKARNYLKETLEVVGPLVAIGGSIVGIIAGIKSIRDKSGN